MLLTFDAQRGLCFSMRSEAVAVEVEVEFRVKRCRKNGGENGLEVGLV